MSDYAEKLIGGWVAGTLTSEERAMLLEASLTNQALFDAMADEEGMRELLADPEVRRELVAVLAAKGAQKKEGWWQRLFKPAPMAAFSAGVLAVVAFVVVRPEFSNRNAAAPAVVGMVEPTAAASQASAKENVAAPADREAPAKLRVRAATPPVVMSRRDAPEQRGLAFDRLEKALEPAAPPATSPAPKPAPMAEVGRQESPPPPPPPAVVAVTAGEALADEAKAKRAASLAPTVAAAPPPPPPPIRYRIERLQQPGGSWVEFGGEMSPGTQARLAIETTQIGVLTVRSGRDVLSVAVQPGQTVHFPGSGSFPAEAGEREVAVLFTPGAPGSLASPLQSIGGFRAKAAPAGPASRQQQQDAAASLSSAEYAVTVRLRYR